MEKLVDDMNPDYWGKDAVNESGDLQITEEMRQKIAMTLGPGLIGKYPHLDPKKLALIRVKDVKNPFVFYLGGVTSNIPMRSTKSAKEAFDNLIEILQDIRRINKKPGDI